MELGALTEVFFCCWTSGEAWREEGGWLATALAPSGDGGLSPWARPLAVLPRIARAWEMESREGAARSSPRESRQMGSEGDGGGRLATWAVGEGAAPAVGVDL